MATLENNNYTMDKNYKKNKFVLKWNYQMQGHGLSNNSQK